MDTTVALFFSLGIVLSPAEQPASTLEADTVNTIIAEQAEKPNQKALKRHELVKKRIAATNAWLDSQRQQRRQLAKAHQPVQVALNQNIGSCDANWTYT